MSISVTRTITKRSDADKASRRERAYDQLYDPVYTLSSEVDHARACFRGYASRLRAVPVFESMFSDVAHYPRCTVQLDPVDPVPVSVDRRWQGQRDQRTEALQQLAGVAPKRAEESQATGAHRWKYFHRPLIPSGQQLPPDVIFDCPDKHLTFTKESDAEQPTHVTVGVQTVYRESETQTDPYTPDYVVQPGAVPSELLQLSFLTWGHGLPAGLAEVEMIERMRAKRALEAKLPPLDDLSQLDKRRHMMELIEIQEWAFREEKIQKLQEARLAVLKDLLQRRDRVQKDATSDRLNQLYLHREKDRDTKLHKIHSDYMRALRKLEAKSRNVEGKLVRRDIVRDAACLSHRGPFTYRNTRRNELRSHYLDTYKGLMKLEAGLESREKRPKVKTTKRAIKPSVSRPEEVIERYRNLVREEKNQAAMASLLFVTKKEKPVPHPVTPRVEEPTEGDEEEELADIYMQKLQRGRSITYEMFKAKENRMELIEELRTVHALQSQEQDLRRAEEELVLTLKKQRDEEMHKAAQDEASQARVVGAELEHLFDNLSKELIHMQEERRIHAFTLLAERDRRQREAEESGRRQMEDRRRRENDELFKQVVEVHQETVDLYLEDLILETLEQTSDQQAREEIHRQAKEVNDMAYALEESRDDLQSEEIVSELVYGFLIPEVEKISVGQKVHRRQQRHLQVAQGKVQEAAELGRILSRTLEASQSTRPPGGASDPEAGAGSSTAP